MVCNIVNLLYMSCHAILEYDELTLFNALARDGHDIRVFSMGSYVNPRRPADEKRPAIEGDYDNEMVSCMMQGLREKLVPDVLERFDACIVMHKPEWVVQNWETFKAWGKPVVWRSIGQSIKPVEDMLRVPRKEGLVVVRYSPREARIPGYIGHDAIIRFAKDPDEWRGWTGENPWAIVIGQRIKGRGVWCNADVLEAVTDGIPHRVYGPDNDDWDRDYWGGLLDYDDLKRAMRQARCLIYGGTVPASYTLVFVEALMTGLPVVAVGPRWMRRVFPDHLTYEVPDILNGVNGYCNDDLGMLRNCVTSLLRDHDLAQQISRAGRQTALELFNANEIKLQWLELFQRIGVL